MVLRPGLDEPRGAERLGGRGKRVGFLELFFDLVFVFAVTQLVGLLHDDHTVAGWARAGLVLWLVWWAWSQYTWAGNAVDLDRRPVRAAVLTVTATMLLAAAAIPTAAGGRALWFAVPYAAVRLAGLALYWHGLRGDPEHRAALRTYLPIAVLSPALVLAGGAAGGGVRFGLWSAAIAVDLVSVAAAGRGEFRVDPAHFAERHGLVVIIALGEAVIATGGSVAQAGPTAAPTALGGAGFAIAAGFWWCYFDWVHAAAEARLVAETDARGRAHLARDLFTLGHLPIVAGIVLYAAGIEEGISHPTDPLPPFGALALGAGVALYLGGFVLGNLRTTGRFLGARLVGLVAAGGWVAGAGTRIPATATVFGVAALVAAVAVTEGVRRRAGRTPSGDDEAITGTGGADRAAARRESG
jgi:low temperature requirement protein LtrA